MKLEMSKSGRHLNRTFRLELSFFLQKVDYLLLLIFRPKKQI